MKKNIIILFVVLSVISCSVQKKEATSREIPYDEDCPAIYEARLIKPAQNYRKLDWDSYAVYGDLPIVKEKYAETSHGRYPAMTIWRTKEATYLAFVHRLGFVRTFFSYSDSTYLRDWDTGERYPIIEVVNFPFNQDFFIEGVPGDHIYMLLKFPPLPKTTQYIDYYEPYVDQTYAYELNHLSIEDLEANHHFLDAAERKIVY